MWQCITVVCALGRSKSPAIRVVQQFVHVNNIENTKVPHNYPVVFMGINHKGPVDSPQTGDSNVESVLMAWCLHAIPNTSYIVYAPNGPLPDAIIGAVRRMTNCSLWYLKKMASYMWRVELLCICSLGLVTCQIHFIEKNVCNMIEIQLKFVLGCAVENSSWLVQGRTYF